MDGLSGKRKKRMTKVEDTIDVLINNYQESTLVWTTGSGTITLPNYLTGFYISVTNKKNGVVTNTKTDGNLIRKEIKI